MIGTISTIPVLSESRDLVGRALFLSSLVLAVAYALTFLSFLREVLLVMILLLVVSWLLGRLGLGSVLVTSALLATFAIGRLLFRPPSHHAIVFRTNSQRGLQSVRLMGHNSGLYKLDQVQVSGIPLSGVMHAWKVVNLTSGQVLIRRGLIRIGFLALIDVVMIARLITHGFA